MKFTEEQLKTFAAPLSDTEQKKCYNAIHMVKDVLKGLGFTDDEGSTSTPDEKTYAYPYKLRNPNSDRKVKIFVQGSYANNTNVRTESDVDIAVVQEEIFIPLYREGITYADYGFSIAPKPKKSFKDEVEECLRKKFREDVKRKNKAIRINGNTYRMDADAVPCRRYRDYSKDYDSNPDNYVGGIVITPDTGEKIINYPEQHLTNGVEKNRNTNRYYKRMVRVIKKMKYLMCEDDNYHNVAENVSSFGLESLLWNIPDSVFTEYPNYQLTFEYLINYLDSNAYSISRYKEVNGIKILCPSHTDVRKYEDFIKALKSFCQIDI